MMDDEDLFKEAGGLVGFLREQFDHATVAQILCISLMFHLHSTGDGKMSLHTAHDLDRFFTALFSAHEVTVHYRRRRHEGVYYKH